MYRILSEMRLRETLYTEYYYSQNGPSYYVALVETSGRDSEITLDDEVQKLKTMGRTLGDASTVEMKPKRYENYLHTHSRLTLASEDRVPSVCDDRS